MDWVDKSSETVGFTTHKKANGTAQFLAATALGIALAFCVPGQISNAHFVSFQSVVEQEVVPAAARAAVEKQPVSDLTFADVEAPQNKTRIFPKFQPEKRPAPVQYASLDLDIPELDTPKLYIEPKPTAPRIISPGIEKKYGTELKLRKKLFGSVELRFDDEQKIRAWSSVYQKFVLDVEVIKSCLEGRQRCGDPVIAGWATELKPLRGLSDLQKIRAVNALVNKRIYGDDMRIYGRSDYWASPSEFLSRPGDCEDFAILKFASLLALGMQDNDLRVVVGRLSDGTPHAFLAAKVENKEYILDNRQSQVYLTANRHDYVPKYSMNLSHRWSHIMPTSNRT